MKTIKIKSAGVKYQLIYLNLLMSCLMPFYGLAQTCSLSNVYGFNSANISNDNSHGSVTWNNPGNANSGDNVYVTADIADATAEPTYYLKALDPISSVPTNATITGILFSIEVKASVGSVIYDDEVKIVKGGVVQNLPNNAWGSAWTTSDVLRGYGGDLWGLTWTPADINAANFGVVISVKSTDATLRTIYIDRIQTTIFYDVPNPANPGNPTSNSPQCSNVTLTRSGSVPAGETWYWQGTSCGTSTVLGSGATYNATSTGTYYIRARDNTSLCWSSGCGSVAVTVDAAPAAPASISSDRDNFCTTDAGNISLTTTGGSGATLNLYTGSCGGTLIGSGTPLSIASPTVTTTYYALWTNTCGNSSCANVSVSVGGITAGTNGIWNGSLNTSWAEECNWDNGILPTSAINVVIPTAASNNCILAGTGDCNNITIESGRTLTHSSGTMNIYGNWTNDGTFTASGGVTAFVGSAAQTIGGANATTFNDLTINNTTGVLADADITLNKAVTVNGALTLTRGYILSTSTNILNMIAGSSTSGTSASSFVDGPMTKAGTTAFTFPTGDGTRWARIGIGAPSSSSTFSAEYFAVTYSNTVSMASTPTPVLNNVSTLEYWQLDRTTGTGDATVTLYWEDAGWSAISECNATPTDLRIAHWNGSAWENNNDASACTGTCTGATAGTISTSAAVTAFSPFTFGSKAGVNPLPITLLRFNATCKDNAVKLSWATGIELNNNYFTIERSSLSFGEDWDETGIVKGAGNSSSIQKYEFTVPIHNGEGWGGASYYRLKQTDYDGKYEYFPPISVRCSPSDDWNLVLRNTPASAALTGTLFVPDDINISLDIIDLQGRLLHRKKMNAVRGSNLIDINLKNIDKGIYFIKAYNDDKAILKKFVCF